MYFGVGLFWDASFEAISNMLYSKKSVYSVNIVFTVWACVSTHLTECYSRGSTCAGQSLGLIYLCCFFVNQQQSATLQFKSQMVGHEVTTGDIN